VRILWLERAEADLNDLFDYLLERDTTAAFRVYDAIRDRVGLLAEHPGLGRPGRVAGTRELVIARTPYIVAYTVDRRIDAVIILRVLHGARVWPDEL
jgi:addiction module RelE/StbE family toxin